MSYNRSVLVALSGIYSRVHMHVSNITIYTEQQQKYICARNSLLSLLSCDFIQYTVISSTLVIQFRYDYSYQQSVRPFYVHFLLVSSRAFIIVIFTDNRGNLRLFFVNKALRFRHRYRFIHATRHNTLYDDDVQRFNVHCT